MDESERLVRSEKRGRNRDGGNGSGIWVRKGQERGWGVSEVEDLKTGEKETKQRGG